MEEEDIKKQAKEDAENLWRNELESPFLEKIINGNRRSKTKSKRRC